MRQRGQSGDTSSAIAAPYTSFITAVNRVRARRTRCRQKYRGPAVGPVAGAVPVAAEHRCRVMAAVPATAREPRQGPALLRAPNDLTNQNHPRLVVPGRRSGADLLAEERHVRGREQDDAPATNAVSCGHTTRRLWTSDSVPGTARSTCSGSSRPTERTSGLSSAAVLASLQGRGGDVRERPFSQRFSRLGEPPPGGSPASRRAQGP